MAAIYGALPRLPKSWPVTQNPCTAEWFVLRSGLYGTYATLSAQGKRSDLQS